MNTQSYVACCNRLISELNLRNIPLRQNMLKPKKQLVESRESSTLRKEYLPTDIELTPFFDVMLDHFDTNVTDWIISLVDKAPKPNWQVVYVPLGNTAIDSDEWHVAAKDPIEAMAFILQQLESNAIKVTTASHSSDGQITISGVDGLLAQIQPIEFEQVSSTSRKRAENGLKGLHMWGASDEYQNKLKRIQGLESLLQRDMGNPNHENRTCLHVTSANICSTMSEALLKITSKEVKRATVQELVAIFFGFDSWNHFRGIEKQRSEDLEVPFYLAYYKPDSEEPPRVLSYSKGLPSALHLFGQRLLREQRRTFHIHHGMYFMASNLTENEKSDLFKGDSLYIEDEGLIVQEMSRVYLGEEQLEAAAELLDSQEFEKKLKSYLFNDCELKNRIIQLHERQGVKNDDHLFVKDWVFWVERSRGSYGWFNGSRLSTMGAASRTLIGSDLHKAAIVYCEESQSFWLATDWNDKPKYCLEGLNLKDVEKIENAFIARNRLMSQLTRLKAKE